MIAAVLAIACRDDSCLEGSCDRPCEDVTFVASTLCQQRVALPLFVGRVRDAAPEYLLRDGSAAAGDVVMTNGVVTLVISDPGAANDLAPTGGNVIDFGPYGGQDDITLVYQIAGILPDDAFAYRTIEYAATSSSVTATVRGTLDGRPEVEVVTHYELASCDEGVRVRTELFNGSADAQAFTVADAVHWGKRRQVPFVPAREQGFAQPELDLLELSAIWEPIDFSSGATPGGQTSYAAVACDRVQLSGVNDLEIAALGTPMTYVAPGDTVSLERMLFAAAGGPASAIDSALELRKQLFGETTVEVTGRIVAGGLPFGGDVRRASVEIYAGMRPVTAVVPRDDGTFVARVPAGENVVAHVWSFGREVATASGTALGDIAVPVPAQLSISVERDSAPQWAMVVLVPDDDITRAAVTGSFHGRLGECAPWLGPPNGASPACNQIIVAPTGTEVEVPAGNYLVVGSVGPVHDLATAHVTLLEGEVEALTLDVPSLDLLPAGWLSADFHVHGRASFDSGIPDVDRVRSFVAQGVDVIAATDHDVIGDYTAVVAELGLEDRVAVMGGLEATQLIPWLDVDGEDLPRVIGHFNFWPLARDLAAPRAGAPGDEGIEPGTLFDRMAPLVGDGGIMMINHPWGDAQFGRDLGYLRAIKYDPRIPLADGPNAALLRRPDGGLRNLDWNAVEVLNGVGITELMRSRTLWFSLLAQGVITAGTGNSDSHGMIDGQLGWARNWVRAVTSVVDFSPEALNAAARDGKMIAGNGVLVFVEIVRASGARRGLGFTPHTLETGDSLVITVKAAPWVPVDEVRITTSRGTTVVATNPAPGIDRFELELPLASLVDRDDFIVVEAGLAYPLVADIDGDGVVDTTDNNGDGRVDEDDVEEDEDVGPLVAPPDPTDPNDRRYLLTRLVPGAWPEGFANPLLVDVDGNGWAPPGLP